MDQKNYENYFRNHSSMNKTTVEEWLKLSETNKRNIFIETSNKMNLPVAAIEKDWWIVRTLELVFSTEIAPFTVFKGGTSLSKAWNLIDRFSEDIDLALDRTFFNFAEEMNPSQVSKLRKESLKYISSNLVPSLQKTFEDNGLTNVELKLNETTTTDQDPSTIEIIYPGLVEKFEYLKPRVLIEIGCRSLREPFTKKEICSFVGEQLKEKEFADLPIIIPTVNPERTFLEKIFLLHEEFQKSPEKIKVNRMSRHLYDIEKLMETEFCQKALDDKDLYNQIVEHRKTITPIRKLDYSKHSHNQINFVPPEQSINAWKEDYEIMQGSMIYAESIPFQDLIERIRDLNTRINRIEE